MVECLRLSPTNTNKRGKEIIVPIPKTKALILAITFTNKRFPKELQELGVPLIRDKSVEESKMRSQIKKTQIALRTGAGSTLNFRTVDKGKIEAIGMPLILNRSTSVSGTETLQNLVEIAKQRGIKKVFLRIRQRVTEAGRSRPRKRAMEKFNVKAYFVNPGQETFKDKRGTKLFSIDNLPEPFKRVLEATWFIHAWDNPDSLVISLTFRRPDEKPSHILSLS